MYFECLRYFNNLKSFSLESSASEYTLTNEFQDFLLKMATNLALFLMFYMNNSVRIKV